MSSTASNERNKLAYFALDLPHKGQASYVHIHEIVDNLRQLGWRVDLFAPRPGSPDEPRSVVAKAYEYLRATWQALWSPDSRRGLRARHYGLAEPWRHGSEGGAVEIGSTELIDLIVIRPWLRPLRRCCAVCVAVHGARNIFFRSPTSCGLLRARRAMTLHSVVPNTAKRTLFPTDGRRSV